MAYPWSFYPAQIFYPASLMNTQSAFSPDTPPTRREFVGLLAAAGAALPLAGLTATARGAETKTAPAPATTASGGPTAIHVFSKPMHTMSHAETAKLLAEVGFGGIDYTVRVAQGHVLPTKVEEDLPRAVEAAHKAGLKVEMITTDIVNARDPLTEKVLRTAAKHGVKIYRLGNWSYDMKAGVRQTIDKLKPTLKELADLNASIGIHGALQNHAGTRIGSPLWDLYELLRDLDPKAIGVQYDIRHAVVEGGQAWPLALRMLAPWIRCTDLKDFKWEQSPGKAVIENVPIGEGIVPFDAYFKLVAELKITGPISVHLEYPPFERAPNMPADEKRTKFVAAMKKDLAAIKGHLAKHKIA